MDKIEEVHGKAPLCQCDCGQRVTWSKGKNEWNRFYSGHGWYVKHSPEDAPFCACGCGQRVTWNEKKGRWLRYVNFEHFRKDINKVQRRRVEPTPFTSYPNWPLCGCGCMQTLVMQNGYVTKYAHHHNSSCDSKYAREKQLYCATITKVQIAEITPTEWLWNPIYKSLQNPRYKYNIEGPGWLKDPPECECGCGLPVKWNHSKQRWNRFRGAHNLNVVSGQSPTLLEADFNLAIPEWIRFTGDRTYLVSVNGKTRYPDFVVEPIKKTKKLIELFGMFHKPEEEPVLIDFYMNAGYECLVVWQNAFYDHKESTMNKVMEYVGVETWQLQIPYDYVTENRVQRKYRDILNKLMPLLDKQCYVLSKDVQNCLGIKQNKVNYIISAMCKFGFIVRHRRKGSQCVYCLPQENPENIEWAKVHWIKIRIRIYLLPHEEKLLQEIVEGGVHPRKHVAKMVLLANEGYANRAICKQMSYASSTVEWWIKQFKDKRIALFLSDIDNTLNIKPDYKKANSP